MIYNLNKIKHRSVSNTLKNSFLFYRCNSYTMWKFINSCNNVLVR